MAVTMQQARESWRRYHQARGVHASFEAFARNIGAVGTDQAPTQAQTPKPAATPKPQPQPQPQPQPEPTARERFEADAELVAEFGSFERFQSYSKAIATGRARLLAPSLAADDELPPPVGRRGQVVRNRPGVLKPTRPPHLERGGKPTPAKPSPAPEPPRPSNNPRT
jgi:hypothetical protein